jgi:hypothetical protein
VRADFGVRSKNWIKILVSKIDFAFGFAGEIITDLTSATLNALVLASSFHVGP